MKDSPRNQKLEAQVRELVFDLEDSRTEFNKLLRQNEEARPIAARILFEESLLISQLRLENAKEWATVMEPVNPPPANQVTKPSERALRWPSVALGAAAACLAGLLWTIWEPKKDELPVISVNWSDDDDREEIVGVMREAKDNRLTPQTVAEGEEIVFNAGNTQIDLDNGVVISVTGPARITVGLEEARLWEGKITVQVPDNLEIYVVETDDGRLVDLGTVFSVSVQPDRGTEIAVLNKKSPGWQSSSQKEVIESQGLAEVRKTLLKDQRHGIRVLETNKMTAGIPILLDQSPFLVPEAYRKLVDASGPILAWDFEGITDGQNIPSRAGPNFTGLTRGEPEIGGANDSGQYLLLGHHDRAGWIEAETPWRKIDRDPFTFELWVRPDRVKWGHLFQLRSTSEIDPVFGKQPVGPVTYFCMELAHSHIFQSKFARPSVRAVFRSPPTAHAYETIPGGANHNLLSPNRYLPGQWHHLVARVGRHDFTLFINGSIATRETIKRPDHGEQELMLRLGRLYDNANLGRQFVGAIDEVALYPRALSDDEVLSHYRAMTRDVE